MEQVLAAHGCLTSDPATPLCKSRGFRGSRAIARDMALCTPSSFASAWHPVADECARPPKSDFTQTLFSATTNTRPHPCRIRYRSPLCCSARAPSRGPRPRSAARARRVLRRARPGLDQTLDRSALPVQDGIAPPAPLPRGNARLRTRLHPRLCPQPALSAAARRARSRGAASGAAGLAADCGDGHGGVREAALRVPPDVPPALDRRAGTLPALLAARSLARKFLRSLLAWGFAPWVDVRCH